MCRTTSLVVPLSVYVGFHVRGGAAPCHVQWPTGASLVSVRASSGQRQLQGNR